MPQLSKSLLGLLALGLLAGCGGSDHADDDTGVGSSGGSIVSPFAGSYGGSASTSGFTPYNFASGTTSVVGSINDDGSIAGQVNDANPQSPFFGLTGTIAGKVNADGTANGTISFAGHNFIVFNTTGSQRLTRPSGGNVVGTINATFDPTDPNQPDQTGTITLTLSD